MWGPSLLSLTRQSLLAPAAAMSLFAVTDIRIGRFRLVSVLRGVRTVARLLTVVACLSAN
jgi:hypothetical protein